jgi:hypothetical protein
MAYPAGLQCPKVRIIVTGFFALAPFRGCAPASRRNQLFLVLDATLSAARATVGLLLDRNFLRPEMRRIIDSHKGLIHLWEDGWFLQGGFRAAFYFLTPRKIESAL